MKSFYKNQNLNLIASMAQQIVFNNSKNGKLESTNTQDAIDEISNILDEEKTMISDAWNIETTYTVGQYCIYDNSLWKCLVQHTGQTPTEGTYWTKTQIDDEILSIKNDVSTINSNLSDVSIISDRNRRMIKSFADKLDVSFYYDNKIYGYGTALIIGNSGIFDFYAFNDIFANATASGVEIKPTISLGTNKSNVYVHNGNGKYDLQFIFTSIYEHGNIILGGAIAAYSS